MITDYKTLRARVVDYVLNRDYTAQQVKDATFDQIAGIIDEVVDPPLTGTMVDKLKVEAVTAIEEKAEDDQLASLRSRIIAHYPDAEFSRAVKRRKRQWIIWPDGKPAVEDDD